MKYKFEKFIPKISLNNYSVAKYVDDKTGKIKLIAERKGSKVKGSSALEFDNQEHLSKKLDEIISYEDWFYNEANALDKLLSVMIPDWT